MDWGEGRYELTAAELAPVAEQLVAEARIKPGERVLDLGCGTGNAALCAARAGARVVAIDPAARLLAVAEERARSEGLSIETAIGEGAQTGRETNEFDAVLANFSVIFAPDPDAVALEMLRVTAPGGRIAMTSWVPAGAIHDSVLVLLRFLPGAPEPSAPWGSEEALVSRFPDAELNVSPHRPRFRVDPPKTGSIRTSASTRSGGPFSEGSQPRTGIAAAPSRFRFSRR